MYLLPAGSFSFSLHLPFQGLSLSLTASPTCLIASLCSSSSASLYSSPSPVPCLYCFLSMFPSLCSALSSFFSLFCLHSLHSFHPISLSFCFCHFPGISLVSFPASSSSTSLPSHATEAGSPPQVLCRGRRSLPPRWPAHQQKAISHPAEEEDSCLRECGARGASRGQAENGVVRKEEEAVFNGMEIK